MPVGGKGPEGCPRLATLSGGVGAWLSGDVDWYGRPGSESLITAGERGQREESGYDRRHGSSRQYQPTSRTGSRSSRGGSARARRRFGRVDGDDAAQVVLRTSGVRVDVVIGRVEGSQFDVEVVVAVHDGGVLPGTRLGEAADRGR